MMGKFWNLKSSNGYDAVIYEDYYNKTVTITHVGFVSGTYPLIKNYTFDELADSHWGRLWKFYCNWKFFDYLGRI